MSQQNELIPPKPQIPTDSLRPFNKFCISIGMLPSSYKTSLTYEEQLLWLCNYLEETVIPAVNNNGEAVTELQNLYVELHDYIDNYFTNLDVQEEINNKLDEMATDGTLTNLISNYINPIINQQNNIILAFQNNVNSQLTLQNEKIEAVESGSPIAVASLQEMTNTNKIYVLTTDGHWYYYANSQWNDGGVYQASVDNAQTTKNTNNINFLNTAPWISLKNNIIYGHSKPMGDLYEVTMTSYGNAQAKLENSIYNNGVNLEAGNYLVLIDATIVSAELDNNNGQISFEIVDGWNTRYKNENAFKKFVTSFPYNYKASGIINFTNTNNIKNGLQLVFDTGFVAESEASFYINNVALLKVSDNISADIIEKYGFLEKYPYFNFPQNYINSLIYDNSSIFEQAYINNQELVANEGYVISGNTACYTVTKFPNRIKQIMAKAKFYGSASAALICEPNGMTNVTDVTKKSIHIVFKNSGVIIGYFNNGILTNTDTINYTIQNDTEVAFGYTIDETNNTLVIHLPTGEDYSVESSEVANYINANGQYA